jgi:hypothetical protein
VSATAHEAGAESGLVNTTHQLGGTRWVAILVALAAGANTLADRVATGYTRGAAMFATALFAALVLIAHPRSLPAAPPAPPRPDKPSGSAPSNAGWPRLITELPALAGRT